MTVPYVLVSYLFYPVAITEPSFESVAYLKCALTLQIGISFPKREKLLFISKTNFVEICMESVVLYYFVECLLNEYSLIISSSRTCTACPVNSETDQTGSSDSRQCKCKKGFRRRLYDDPCERK